MPRLLNSSSTAGTFPSHVLAWTVALLWASCLLPAQAFQEYTPYLQQGFFFDWTPQGQSPPVPTTAQCETIHIAWERGTATGPNPTAPYTLQIYTSAFIVPLIIPAGNDPTALEYDLPIPFVPGTQYEICMFDSNGVTGGCQAVYTVYQAPNYTLSDPPTCRNFTYPQPSQVLNVDAQVDNGPLSEYGWIDQCTDIMLTPKNGTPPYTMTIAPALHPPFVITSKTMDSINWTISLSYGMPFFVSLTDSSGASWANGPLHSGGGGTTECLSLTNTDTSNHKEIQPWIAAVSGAGGLIVGIIVGLLGACLFVRLQRRRTFPRSRPDTLHRKSSSMSVTAPVLGQIPSNDQYTDNPPDMISTHQRLRDGPYQIEPFAMPTDGERAGSRMTAYDRSSGAGQDLNGHSRSMSLTQDHSRSPATSVSSPMSSSPPSHSQTPSTSSAPLLRPPRPLSAENRTSSQVFVVHHDGGRPPVTVYGPDGTEVVELPPRYTDSGASTTGASTQGAAITGPVPPLQLQDRRQLGPSPPKGPRRVVNLS